MSVNIYQVCKASRNSYAELKLNNDISNISRTILFFFFQKIRSIRFYLSVSKSFSCLELGDSAYPPWFIGIIDVENDQVNDIFSSLLDFQLLNCPKESLFLRKRCIKWQCDDVTNSKLDNILPVKGFTG